MKYVIAGFGKFGRIALERLLRAFPDQRIVLVEQRAEKRPTGFPTQVGWIHQDAVSFLTQSSELRPEDVIIPMVPFHLLAAYVMARRAGCREVPLPDGLDTALPNPFRMDPSNLCCSRADFLCPDDCPEGERCTVTGELREPLHAALEQLASPGFTVLVQRSFQILPGVGGYRVSQITDLAAQVKKGRYILATSCKCHAILTAVLA